MTQPYHCFTCDGLFGTSGELASWVNCPDCGSRHLGPVNTQEYRERWERLCAEVGTEKAPDA